MICCAVIVVPQYDTTWSKILCASRIDPSPFFAMIINESSSIAIFSSPAIYRSRDMISSIVMRRKSYRWHRERIVAGTLCTSVVAKMKRTCGGGSSSVFRSALNASFVSMWTSSMMYTLYLPRAGA